MDAAVALVAVGWRLPWSDPVFAALVGLLAWRGQGLPVIALLACVADLAPSLLGDVCAWGALLLLAIHGLWWAAALAAFLLGPAAGGYLLWLRLMPDRSWGERHVLAALLALALGCREALPVAVPVAALLSLGGALQRRWLGRPSPGGFALGLGTAVAATVWLCGGAVPMSAWLIAKATLLWREALALLCLLALGAALLAGGRLRGSSHAADRKVFHAAIVAICAVPFAVSRRAERVDESLALGGMLGVCALLAVELFRVHSGKNGLARRLNAWFEPWIDEKDRGQPVATTHLHLVLGCVAPFATAHFAGLGPGGAARFAGVVAVGVGDAAAAAIGSRFGRTRWRADCGRTLEGSAALCVCVWLCLVLLPGGGVAPMLAAMAVALAEAWTSHMDNLVLPLFLFAILNK